MKRFLCLIFLFFTFNFCEAQYIVKFKLGKHPPAHAKDSIFIAGNFNDWDPGNPVYSLPGNDKTITLFSKLKGGHYEYKCTRGDWNKVESQKLGKDVENHEFEVTGDTTITLNIEAWKDDYPPAGKKHTASKQVQVMDTAFFIPQLNRYRRIWVYLPEGYAKNKKKLPVLYMHDGQNLFDAATSSFGEWGVDECLDSLIRSGTQACIVVGIDNGSQRLSEYNPYEFKNFGKGEGDLYLDFIVNTLKPFIDKHYQTLTGKENTMIAGSSMGGLISYYAMLKKPGVFGQAGVFSPAFWTAPAIKSLTDSLAAKVNGKFFFYIGEKEGEDYVKDMEDIQEIMGEKSTALIYSVKDPAGTHNEKAWRKWFAEFYTWMMANGFNTVIKVSN